jgi:hypothetical protein
MDVAVQIGLEGDEFDSALDYAADQGWFEDAEVSEQRQLGFAHAYWCGRCEILIANVAQAHASKIVAQADRLTRFREISYQTIVKPI